ncbi:MAG: serine hydroxymethyltransferase [Dehalococcoidia bacterium]|nr:serine hydroxymethyltransferase [Dehalococcoidia bacterium]
MGVLADRDPEVALAIDKEADRQRRSIVLIASENFASRAVLEAQGSHLTNKYAEGYPGHRYYGGCEFVDIIEQLAIDRAKALFGAEHANVQPHSGSQANMAAYFALLEPGDRVMGMRLDSGGHLTHGSPVNFSGKLYNFAAYGVDRETERIDYDQVERLAREHRPKLIREFGVRPRLLVQRRGGWRGQVDGAGLIAAGVHPSPLPYAQIVTSTTHKTLRGPRGAFIMCNEALARPVDRSVFPVTQGGPLMHAIAAKAVAFGEAAQPQFREYQRAVVENARTLAQGLMGAGLRVVSGGTDNHLILVDLTSTGVTGQEADTALGRVNIVVNKNTMPFDPRPPQVTSGLRFGTPAVTSRGFGPREMRDIATLVAKVLSNMGSKAVEKEVREDVEKMTARFPVPGLDP